MYIYITVIESVWRSDSLYGFSIEELTLRFVWIVVWCTFHRPWKCRMLKHMESYMSFSKKDYMLNTLWCK